MLDLVRLKLEDENSDSYTIQWLINFSHQIAQELDSNLKSIEIQMNFLMSVFKLIYDENENSPAVYHFLKKNLSLINEEIISILAIWVWSYDSRLDFFINGIIGFANIISGFSLGTRSINLEIAIDCFHLVLDVYTSLSVSKGCAMAQVRLAGVYQTRIKGERAVNLEESITYYCLALKVITRESDPEDWVMIQMNLGIAYKNRIRGEKANNIEMSISYYQLALEVYSRETNSKMWAMTQMNLANAYKARIKGENSANLEESIRCSLLALESITYESYPEMWAMTQMNLGNAYRNRIQGKRSENLEQSIHRHRLALEVYTSVAYPEMWAMTQMNLGNAYQERMQGEQAENIEEAISCCVFALQIITRAAYPAQWALIQKNISICYRHRIRGDRSENIEAAINHSRLALEIYTREAFPEQWALTHITLGNVYQQRNQGDRVKNLELAIEFYNSALEIFTPQLFPVHCLSVAQDLGNLYFNQSEFKVVSEGILLLHQGMWQQAIESYDLAIQAVETSRSWATDENSRQRIISEALIVYENTIQAYINLGQIDKAITTSERARSRQLVDFMATQDLYPAGEIPSEVRELLAKYQDINSQIRSYQTLDSGDSLERTDRSTRNSETFAANNAAIESLTAEKNHIWQAIRKQDHEIAGQIQVNPIDLPSIQTLIPNPHTAILSFYTTENDTHIFIITHDNEPQIHTCLGQGLINFQQWLSESWLKLYLDNFTTWRNQIANPLTEIAHRLDLDVLIAKLDNINELIIIPHLYLHQIPFAAIPLEEVGGGFLGDRFTISYAPSCQILKYCTDRPAIESPQYGTIEDADGTLPGAGFEGHQIAELFQIQPEYRLVC